MVKLTASTASNDANHTPVKACHSEVLVVSPAPSSTSWIRRRLPAEMALNCASVTFDTATSSPSTGKTSSGQMTGTESLVTCTVRWIYSPESELAVTSPLSLLAGAGWVEAVWSTIGDRRDGDEVETLKGL